MDEHPRPTSNKATLDAGSNPKGFFSEPRAQRCLPSIQFHSKWRVEQWIRPSLTTRMGCRYLSSLGACDDRSRACGQVSEPLAPYTIRPQAHPKIWLRICPPICTCVHATIFTPAQSSVHEDKTRPSSRFRTHPESEENFPSHRVILLNTNQRSGDFHFRF